VIGIFAGEDLDFEGEHSENSYRLVRDIPFVKAAHECCSQFYVRGQPKAARVSESTYEQAGRMLPSIWDTTFIITYRRQHEIDRMQEQRGYGASTAFWGPDYEANTGALALPKVSRQEGQVKIPEKISMPCDSLRFFLS
jgi:hypothetical protein